MTEFRPSSFQVLPVIIKNLLIINGLVFLAQFTFDGMSPYGGVAIGYVSNHFALHHILSPLFEPWQLITHIFMHGSLGTKAFPGFLYYMWFGSGFITPGISVLRKFSVNF
jgi:membrane associated rhomboid family serine protease